MGKIILYAVILFSVASCKTIFTEDMRTRLTSEELKKVQYYTSSKLHMERKLTSGEAKTVNGDIKLIDGTYYEIIDIPQMTPGILVRNGGSNNFEVTFDPVSSRALKFTNMPTGEADAFFLATNYNAPCFDESCNVMFDGKLFTATFPTALNNIHPTHLLIGKQGSKTVSKTKEKLKGVRIAE